VEVAPTFLLISEMALQQQQWRQQQQEQHLGAA
jgi:hypothetical protein